MIRVLRPDVVSKIAAGEVVERPFSVLKELVENSLDAGASSIRVDLEDGGRTLLRVSDDGHGMSRDDLALAFVQHATSKLGDVDDLDAIASLGFRGEALASIGAVSRARVVSRAGEREGWEVLAEGGAISDVRPAAAAPGTVVEVRDLFFNVPARRRFLKTPTAERTRCVDVLTKLALAHTDVGFTLEGTRRLDLTRGEPLASRVGKLFGDELEARCLRVESARGGITVEGLVGDPDAARRDRTQLNLFVNGRPIRDRSLAHAIEDAFREFLMGGRYPVTFLFLGMDPSRVDVNVHPTKAEVRFAEPRLVYTAVRSAVLEALGGRAQRIAGRAAGAAESANAPRPVTGFPEMPKGLFGTPDGIGGGFGRVETPAPRARPAEAVHEPRRERRPQEAWPVQRTERFLVVKNLYIVFETDDGFAVVDQHALHERVVYERMLAAWRDGSVPIQRLLLPAVVELPAADKDLLLAHKDTLERAGLLLDDLGGAAVKLTGYPTVLRRVDPHALLGSVVADLREGGALTEPEDVRERFHSAACRSAVMAGDRLSDEEIRDLLKAASTLEHPHNCPHGRPTVVNYTTGQLERFFKRRI